MSVNSGAQAALSLLIVSVIVLLIFAWWFNIRWDDVKDFFKGVLNER